MVNFITTHGAAGLATFAGGIYVTYSIVQGDAQVSAILISEVAKGAFIGAVSAMGLIFSFSPPNSFIHKTVKIASPIIGGAIGGVVGGVLQINQFRQQ